MKIKGIKTMINLSGGYDSTYVLWRWLTDNPEDRILVHRCRLQSNQKRMQAEDTAVKNILKWLRSKGLDNFEVFETRFEFVSSGKSYDYNVIAFINALIFRLREFRDIKTLLVCQNSTDTNMVPFSDTLKYYKGVEANPGFLAIPDRYIKTEYPIIDMPKPEIASLLPEELRKVCWSCATPIYDDDGNAIECGRCLTCQRIQ